MKLQETTRQLSKMVKPMLLGKADKTLIPNYEKLGYVASEKKDGVRVIAIKENNKIILMGRSGYTYETKFKEIVKALEFIPDGTILDGEVVAGTFQHTQARTLTKNKFKIDEYEKLYPATYYVFDILAYEYEDLCDLSLWERLGYIKIVQEKASVGVLFIENTTNIEELWKKAQKEGWEGICIKNKNSRYEFGKRSNEWLKLKCVKQRVIEFESYTQNNAGVRAVSKEGIAVQVAGHHSRKFLEQYEKNGVVSVEVEYLEQMKSGALRMPVCKEVLE